MFVEGDLRLGFSSGTMNFGGDPFFGPLSTATIEIGGLNLGCQFDHIEIPGAANLGGSLDILLVNGFAPTSGNSFEVLHAAGGIVDMLGDVTLPGKNSGLNWSLIYSGFSVILHVESPQLPGDHNHDAPPPPPTTLSGARPAAHKTTTNTWRANFGRAYYTGSCGVPLRIPPSRNGQQW